MKDVEETEILPCAEKMVFDTSEQAEAVGRAAEWQYGGALKSYRCRYCGLWHLSTSIKDE